MFQSFSFWSHEKFATINPLDLIHFMSVLASSSSTAACNYPDARFVVNDWAIAPDKNNPKMCTVAIDFQRFSSKDTKSTGQPLRFKAYRATDFGCGNYSIQNRDLHDIASLANEQFAGHA